MKKSIFTLFLSFFALFSCAEQKYDSVVVPATSLPQIAQEFLNTHFAGIAVLQVIKDSDFLEKTTYDVHLQNGFEIEFRANGDWDDVDGNTQTLPQSIVNLLPEGIRTYISANFAGRTIVEINKERISMSDGYEISLNEDLELEFKGDGTFVRIDN